jgi:putative membrane protein
VTVRMGQLSLHRRLSAGRIARRFLPPFILAGYGIFILSLFARHEMSLYINPVYIGPTTLAGAILVGLSAIGLARRHDNESESTCDDDCACEEPPTHAGTYLLLGLPLLLALLVPPHSLASFSANQRGTQLAGLTTVHGAGTVQRVSLSVDTRSFTMTDWVGALSADPNPRDYQGKGVIVSGLAIHNSSSVPPGYIMVIRYLVTCCIADARPVGMIVRDSSNGTLQDNQWVTVTGTMGEASYQGQKVAVVEPTKIQPGKSQDPYIY